MTDLPDPDQKFLEEVASDLPSQKRWDRTDVGNAEMLAHLYGQDLRYDPALGWMAWNGKHWQANERRAVQLVIAMARRRYFDASKLEYDEAKKEAAWALSSQQVNRVMGCLQLARSLDIFAVPAWDPDPWLLGVNNGVVDLRSGRLLRHMRGQYITQLSPVDYDITASAPRWVQFMEEVFPDKSVREFVQRAIGYSLTGITSEQAFFLCFGKGANGKSKLLYALKEILGPHSYSAAFSTFERGKKEIPSDVAALKGKRFVMASEAKDATLIDEARIKALTGDDEIAARFLHRDWFNFRPTLKLWLAVNHRPIVDDDSIGIWRRMKLIPFTQTFDPTKETDIEEKFKRELPGILAWAVMGCLDWIDQGLMAPDILSEAVDDYKREMNPLEQFIIETCEESPTATVGATAFYKSYQSWAKAVGYSDREILTLTAFGRKMAERFKKKHSRAGWYYFGVRIIS